MRKVSAQRVTVVAVGVALVAAMFYWRAESKTPPPAAGDEAARAGLRAPTDTAVSATPRTTMPAPPAPPAATPVITSRQIAAFNESILMARLRSVAASDSAQAVELARQGNHLYPDSPTEPERTSILIHALANLDRTREARGEAERMVNHYPDSSWVREIEGFSGAHRHRSIRVNDAGLVESD